MIDITGGLGGLWSHRAAAGRLAGNGPGTAGFESALSARFEDLLGSVEPDATDAPMPQETALQHALSVGGTWMLARAEAA